MPCQNGALCFERSNTTLYLPGVVGELPEGVQSLFNRSFDYEQAAGYVCSCMPGYEGEFQPTVHFPGFVLKLFSHS